MTRKPQAFFPPVTDNPPALADTPPDYPGTYQLVDAANNAPVGWIMVRAEQTAFISVHACDRSRNLVTLEYHVEIERFHEAWGRCLADLAQAVDMPVGRLTWRHGVLR